MAMQPTRPTPARSMPTMHRRGWRAPCRLHVPISNRSPRACVVWPTQTPIACWPPVRNAPSRWPAAQRLRAPHRLAAWVACSGPRGSRSSAAAEMVALFDAVSSGAAELAEIARRLQGPAHARSAADERPAAALAPRQRAAAPWQRWLV